MLGSGGKAGSFGEEKARPLLQERVMAATRLPARLA